MVLVQAHVTKQTKDKDSLMRDMSFISNKGRKYWIMQLIVDPRLVRVIKSTLYIFSLNMWAPKTLGVLITNLNPYLFTNDSLVSHIWDLCKQCRHRGGISSVSALTAIFQAKFSKRNN